MGSERGVDSVCSALRRFEVEMARQSRGDCFTADWNEGQRQSRLADWRHAMRANEAAIVLFQRSPSELGSTNVFSRQEMSDESGFGRDNRQKGVRSYEVL